MGNFKLDANQINHTILTQEIQVFSNYLVNEFGSIGKHNFNITISNNTNQFPSNFPSWATGIAINNSIFIDNKKIHNNLIKNFFVQKY